MTSTVIISTFNGSKYIKEQMTSIFNQSIKPDEVLICDDCSSDNTPQIIKEFITSHNLTSWKLFINEKNIGWKKNFYKLMLQSHSDITFLCDQDDYWNNEKIKIMLSYFSNSHINVLCSEYSNVNNKNFHDVINAHVERSSSISLSPYLFSQKFMYVKYPGCTYAFRTSYLKQINKYWKDFFPHDAFLFRNAELDNSLYIINMDLLTRRIHNSNASINKSRRSYSINFDNETDACKTLLERLEEDNTIISKDIKKKYIENEIRKISIQKKSISKCKIYYFLRVIKYYNTYIDFHAFLKEILFLKKL